MSSRPAWVVAAQCSSDVAASVCLSGEDGLKIELAKSLVVELKFWFGAQIRDNVNSARDQFIASRACAPCEKIS